MIPNPLENRFYKLFRKYLNVENGVGWSCGGRHKSYLSCSPNSGCAMPLPFWSTLLFLSKIKVHVSPLSKYDEPELKSELTWWVSQWARAWVIGPSGISEVDAGVGVDILFWWVSQRARAWVIGPSGISEVDAGVGVDILLVVIVFGGDTIQESRSFWPNRMSTHFNRPNLIIHG
jgi:hypothetical protein